MKTILKIFVISIVYSTNLNGQSVEKIVHKNASKACRCFEKIDYIDSQLDFEIKYDSCSQLNKEDSIKIQKEMSLREYKKLLKSKLDKCTALNSKLALLFKSYKQSNSSIYKSEGLYKELKEKLIGTYDYDGSSLFLYNKDNFIIVAFGTLKTGTWEIVKNKYLHLNPYKPKHPFKIYGRYNPTISDSTKTAFIGDNFSYNTLIHYGKIEKNPVALSPIFNRDANCYEYPNIDVRKHTFKEISLAAFHSNNYSSYGKENTLLYTYKNTKNFNDFIIYESIEENEDGDEPIRAIIDRNGLIFKKGEISKKNPLRDEMMEEINTMKQMATQITGTSKNIYYNLGYKDFDDRIINSGNYTYNSKSNTYNYIGKEILDQNMKENDYDNFFTINKYELLENVTTKRKKVSITEKSIIYTVCD